MNLVPKTYFEFKTLNRVVLDLLPAGILAKYYRAISTQADAMLMHRVTLLMHHPAMPMYRLTLLMHRPTLLMYGVTLLMYRSTMPMYRFTLLMHRPAKI
ncbi:hypothetical protein H6G27_08075 [Nostoc linckia FACHB-104]|nr:hypothetical protein [Nostoc linckia FACHB-104]